MTSRVRSLRRSQLLRRQHTIRRLFLEKLEDRSLLAGFIGTPNDPGFPQQWMLNNTGQTGGVIDADIDAPEAWSVTTGSTSTIIAVLDGGIDYTNPDLYLNIWLNQGEIPANIAASLTDFDADGLITFRDLNAPANASFVTDLNGNSYIDGGDLLSDPRWENGLDDDGNGLVDDLIGWDFHDHDNDPSPTPDDTHGTEVSLKIAGVGNNGIGNAGVMWAARIIPLRIELNNKTRVVENAAAGLDYAVSMGATISNNCWGDYIYSQVMFDAIDRARLAGHLFVTSAGNEGQDIDVSPRYPAAYALDNIVADMALNASDQPSPGGNWGHVNIDLGCSSENGTTSTATPHVTGVAGLLRTLHPDWTYSQIKDRILSTVDPLPALAGKCVTGGRLNAANALGVVQLKISDAVATEGSGPASQAMFVVSLNGPATSQVTVGYATANGTALANSDYVAASGTIIFLPGETSRTVVINTIDDTIFETNETFVVNLSNPTGGVIADSQGVGTIIDTDPQPTKFYVVDDATVNKTFEYSASGSAVENYSVNSSNSAPRGAASTVAGNKVWVVDANKNVYVYNTSGGLLGSWAAGTLASNADVQGITTNGTDVWIVDAKSDKVFRYTGAASRLSGSQNAASSFALGSGNGAPTDLVTDGTSLWVLNENNNDKVFKYTVSGTALGNWTISTAGVSSPTGITLDPAAPSHLWIVDSGTDRVYQYNAAVGRTSGSQAASTSFALAAGNTNPQGIADPPVGGSLASAVDVVLSGDVAAAPMLAGDQAIPTTGQALAPVGDRDEQDGPGMFADGISSPASLLSADAGVKRENSALGTRFMPYSTFDEALCGIADELDSLTPTNGQWIQRL